MLCTWCAYAFLEVRDIPPAAGPPMMVLISPVGPGFGVSVRFLGPWVFGGRVLCGQPTYFWSFPCRISVSTCSFKAMQFSVRWPWSLWKQQYRFFAQLSGSERIFPGHRREGSSWICMRSWSKAVFNGVKILNFTLGNVVLFLSSVSENLGTFCLVGSCIRSSTSFLLLGGGSSQDFMASSAFMCFCASYMSSDNVSGGSLQRS